MKVGIIFVIVAALIGTRIALLTPSPDASDSLAAETIPTGNADSLRLGGNSYADTKGVYVFLYPNDYKQDIQNNGQYARIYKIGKTQQGQTEMYDGVNLNFESVNLNGQTLEKWVDAQIANSLQDSSFEVTVPKAKVTMNGYSGFSYSLRGLGESKYIVLQKDTNSSFAVNIVYMVIDPENEGYQDEVNAIFSTLELLK